MKKSYKLDNKIVLNNYLESEIDRLDRKIKVLSSEIEHLIFENIPDVKKNGNVEIPIVMNDEFKKLKYERSLLSKEMGQLSFKLLHSDELSQEEKLSLREEMQLLKCKSEQIENNQKLFLRKVEAYNHDTSNVDDETIKAIIECKKADLKLAIKSKEKLSKHTNKKNVQVRKYKRNPKDKNR